MKSTALTCTLALGAAVALGLSGCKDAGSLAPPAHAKTPSKAKGHATMHGSAKMMKGHTMWWAVDPGAARPQPIQHAVAVMNPTESHKVAGVIEFTQTPKGLKVQTALSGLEPGTTHGYHVHVYGDCSASDGTSAGTHFNFKGSSLNPPKDVGRITGNLGEIKANAKGVAADTTVIEGASLTGRYSIVGRAVIVHAKGNDASKPPIGAAGARLACGVIGLDGAK